MEILTDGTKDVFVEKRTSQRSREEESWKRLLGCKVQPVNRLTKINRNSTKRTRSEP